MPHAACNTRTCRMQLTAAGAKGRGGRGWGETFCVQLHFLSRHEVKLIGNKNRAGVFLLFISPITNCNNPKTTTNTYMYLQVDPAWTIPYSRPYPTQTSTATNNPIRVSLPTWRPDARVSLSPIKFDFKFNSLLYIGWHYCDIDGRQASFLCPNGTQFSQAVFVCDWWFNVRCDLSPRLYAINARLYQRPKVNPTRPHRIITKQLVEDIFTWSARMSAPTQATYLSLSIDFM